MAARLTPEERDKRDAEKAEKARLKAERVAKAEQEAAVFRAAAEQRAAATAEEMAHQISNFASKYDDEVEQMLNEGLIDKAPSPQAKKKIFDAYSAEPEEDRSLPDLVEMCCPQIKSQRWKAETQALRKAERQEADAQDREDRMGKYAPEVTLQNVETIKPGERPATEGQLYYLRRLGYRDEAVLGKISTATATSLIAEIKELREKGNVKENYVPTSRGRAAHMKSGSSVGEGPSYGLLIGLAVGVLLLLLWLGSKK